MRAGILLAVVLGLGFAMAASAQSQDEQIMRKGSSGGTDTPPPAVDDEEMSSTYSSIGVQKVHADFDNVKDAINLDIVAFGFRVPTVPWVGVELNLGFTFLPGQIDPNAGTPDDPGTCTPIPFPGCRPATQGTQATSGGDFQATNVGASLVLRSPGTFFVVGKYGYRYLNTSIDQLRDDRSGTQYAAGVGYRWNKKGSYVEFGYNKIADKIDALGFSLSYSYDRR